MKKTVALALACISIWTTARAVDCNKPPFGDSTEKYQQFILNGEVASKGDLKLAKFIAFVGKVELMSACNAKFYHRGVQRYAQMGLSVDDLGSHSVSEIATYATSWKARQGEAAGQADDSPRTITVNQFAIDGQKMASEGIKVLVNGAYLRQGDSEYLYADSTAIEIQMGSAPMYEPHIALLTDDATDQAKSKFLACSEDPAGAQIGCSVTVEGTVTTCEETNAYGTSRSLPCIAVKDIRP